jgi:3-dehydroquinate dehydratase-2
MEILIINGPNLNLLGIREPEIYGTQSFENYLVSLKKQFQKVEISYYQSNVEGEIISKLQEYGFGNFGIILNAGGYSHTSVAIADTVAAIESPVVEVHISNVFAREEYRHYSLISKHARGMIVGLGLEGYGLAINWLQKQFDGGN